MSADFQKTKSDVLGALREVATLAEDAGANVLAKKLHDERIPRLEQERFHLVVLGEFNHGKTTFVNALLGTPVLPTGVTPTTAVIHHIEHGDRPAAVAVSTEGTPAPLELDGLTEYVVGGKAVRDAVRHLIVSYPAPLLADGVVLVDTPGVNDLNEARAEITYGYIPQADAVIFLLDAGQILKESERAFISGKLLSQSRDKVFFVINKMDLLSPEERDEALAYARMHLAKLAPDPKIYGISAQRALAGDRAASGIDPFLDELRTFLQDERGRVLLDNAIGDGLRTSEMLRTGIEVQRHALAMDDAELEKRLGALEADLEGSRRAVEERRQRVRESIARVKALVRADCEAFGKRFAAALPGEIEAAEAKELRRYLGGFVEEKFREFAEGEAEEVARKLEGVAEEAIAFLAEDAKARADRLGAALGPAAPKLDLSINTFAYDVGVFALGAFGITLMALSNVLVGGAMALAAPVLAWVFRGRADQKVKERAIEDAPKVVREAAAKMATAFEAQIDEFGERLSDFVARATEEMSRSIAEVVRAARDAKREGEDARVRLESSGGMALARLANVDQRLQAIRGALWGNGSSATS